jgi:proteasome lid subunit RPN8/RPN11
VTLGIDAGARRALVEACERAGRREACGFLLGAARPEPVATAVVEAGASDGAAFEVAAYEVRRARAVAAERGLQILALFHSHPSGRPEPSEADLAALRTSEWPWVIVVAGPGGLALAAYAPPSARPLRVAQAGASV